MKIDFRRIFAVLVLLVYSLVLVAQTQQITVKGTVTDIKKLPLPGASVVERGENNRLIGGTVTDMNGNFQLKVTNSEATLVFTFIGMIQQIIPLKGRTVLNVTLEDETISLGTITIVGAVKADVVNNGFMQVEKRNVASASVSIKMEEIKELPAASVEELLDGRVSGLMVSMNSGDPGSSATIQLRGAGSLGLNTRPLIVVDGIPWKDQMPADQDLTSSESISNLLNISPTDITNIEILKDAAATAVFGSEGSNGVIVITTKRGNKMKPQVSFTSKLSATQAPRMLPLLNGTQYKTMMLEAYQNRFFMEKTPEDLFLEPGSYNYENYNNNTDWIKKVGHLGYQTDNNLSIRGGGDATGYSISLGYLNERGTTIGTDYSRINGRLAFDYKVSDKLKFLSDFAYVHGVKDENTSSLISIANVIAPIKPVFFQDIFGNDTFYYFLNPSGYQGNVVNPVATAALASASTTSDQLNSSVQAEFRPLKDRNKLFISSLFSLQYNNSENSKFLPRSATGKDYNFSTISSGINTATTLPQYGLSIYQKNWITYNLRSDKHLIMLGGGTIMRQNTSESISIVMDNLPSEYITDPYSSKIFSTLTSSSALDRSISLTSQGIYTYGDRYSIQGIFRRDGSSNFGGRNRFGNFPSLSGFWRPSSEPFLKDQKWLNDCKIRFSWGLTGRAPGASSNYATFSSNTPYGDMVGVKPNNFELSNLRWEKTTQLNIGLDFAAFDNRLSLTAELYDNTTRDLLWSRPVPTNSGFATASQNFGALNNRGVEVELFGIIFKNKDWRISTGLNVYKNRSLILSLPGGNEISKQTSIGNGMIIQRVKVWDSFGTFYGFRYKGVFKANEDAFLRNNDGSFVTNLSGEKIPIRWNNKDGVAFQGGDAIYEDINNDGVINMQDVVKIGNSSPLFAGGFNLMVNYKDFRFGSQFSFRYGNQIFNATKMLTTNMYNENNQSTAVMRRWRKQGDVTDIPRAIYGAGNNWVGSDRYVEDGSYIRLSNIYFGYNMPKTIMKHIGLKALSFTLSGSNLLLLTKYSGVDPEVGTGSNTDPFGIGQDNAISPRAKYFTLTSIISF